MIEKINAIIDEWDPIKFFPFALSDDYSDEIRAIYNTYKSGMGAKELACVIHQVFLNSFGSNTFTKSTIECEEIAKSILQILETE